MNEAGISALEAFLSTQVKVFWFPEEYPSTPLKLINNILQLLVP